MCNTTALVLLGSSQSADEENIPTEVPAYVPADTLSQAAYDVARSNLHPTILNHSLRTFIYALSVSEQEKLGWHEPDRLPLLFTAAIFHDMGTTDICDGPQRFEVEGADAAVSFLRGHDVPEEDRKEVWLAIGLHTCSGIAERATTMSRSIRQGVLIDFKRPAVLKLVDPVLIDKVERIFSRGEPEKILGDAVVEQALRQPSKAPSATWPGQLTRSRRENPEWQGVNKEF
ncbi:hypothetical protein LTR09_005170 [Extremus antarcticus]|uniref:HD domain-containing protein n=1 Tax=Extremus antarcticus TaxID=702011 RepID=A0AAJ0GCK4_9PEZI|nr:hypothetical protein LTR09_005170 [Extremus antarcticus]